MTREEAIWYLTPIAESASLERYKEALGLALSALQNQPVWIPVAERLPENIGLYLVIEKHWLDGSPCRKVAIWNTADWFTSDRKRKEITPRVTHWMPLPEPPKEDSNAKM